MSNSMELDEAEQYWYANYPFSLGYSHQPPLYTWICKTITSFIGLNIKVLTLIKYSILFMFYSSFYLLCRYFWTSKHSLLVTASLLSFPVFVFSFIFDLTHTILVTAIASICLHLYFRTIINKHLINYALLGIAFGLGLLAKYTFIVFLIALLLASFSSKLSKKALLNPKIITTILLCTVVFLPHFIWVIKDGFYSFNYALNSSETASGIGIVGSLLLITKKYIVQFLPLLGVFFVFFVPILKTKATRKKETTKVVRSLALISFLIPIITVLAMQTGEFQARWATISFATVALALFTFAEMQKLNKAKLTILFTALGLACMSIFTVRTTLFFFPGFYGSTKKVGIDFLGVSQGFLDRIKESGINIEEALIVTKRKHIAANLKQSLQELGYKVSIYNPQNTNTSSIQIIMLHDLEQQGILNSRNSLPKNIIFAWSIKKYGKEIHKEAKKAFPELHKLKPVRVKYLNVKEKPKFSLGIAINT